jgi:hypothetical protein
MRRRSWEILVLSIGILSKLGSLFLIGMRHQERMISYNLTSVMSHISVSYQQESDLVDTGKFSDN